MIESMLHKVTEYAILSLASFCLFSALFRGVAYAQVPLPSEAPLTAAPSPAPKQLAQEIPPSPTPTIYNTQQPVTSPSPTTTQTQQTITPTPEAAKPTATPTSAKSGPTPTVAASKQKVTPTKTLPSPTPTTAPVAQPAASGSNADQLFSMVNSYRQSKGLPAFIKDDRVCSLANARANEIAAEMSAGTLHSGMYARNLPYWNTENAAAYGTVEESFNWWLQDGIHRQAIESNKTYSCTACSGVYCVQEFTSFEAK